MTVLWPLLTIIVVALAVWGWRHASTDTAFFAASRTAGAVLAGVGGTAAGLSAFVFVGGPGYFAAVGAASLWVILSAPVTGALQCWAVGEPIIDLIEKHRCLTIPDIVAARFGEGAPRALAATAVVIGGIATLAVQVKGTAVIGEILLDVPGWLVAVCAVSATVLYTAAGGMRAGLLAEAAQGVLMATAAIVLAATALYRAGGPTAAIDTIAELKPQLLDVWQPSGPTAALGVFALFALGTCAQPHYLQKFLFLRDRASLRWMPMVMTVALLSVLTVWIGVGLGGTALWLRGDLAAAVPDEIAPALLAGLDPGLVTLALVAVIAAVMSTAASLLNLVAAAVTRDLPRAFGGRPASTLTPARWATVAAGGSGTAIALMSDRSVALLGILGWGTFAAALLPVMVLGLNWKGARRRGAIAALAVGPAVQIGLELARAGDLLAARWEPGLTGAAVGMLVMVLLSTRSDSEPGREGEGERNH